MHTQLKLEAVSDILQCPSCGAGIASTGKTWRCKEKNCSGGGDFLSVHGQPILIDAGSSVLSPSSIAAMQGSSPISRRNAGIPDRVLTALGLTTARATRRNCHRFLSALPRVSDRRPRVLIIGGGARGVGTEELYARPDIDILNFDIYATTDTHFIADSHRIPLRANSIDGVWIQAVLEHVVEPAAVAAEIHRVLNQDGVVYSEVPFIQHVHEGAYDFTRFTLSGHRYLFRDFDVIDAGVHGGVGTQLNWSIDHFVRAIFRSRHAGKLAKILTVWLVWFDAIASQRHSVDAASGTYMMARRSGKRISHRAAVEFYSGAG